MPTTKIHDIATGEEIEREMTTDELVQWEAGKAAELIELEAKTTKAANKAALLEKLGITDLEAELLLS